MLSWYHTLPVAWAGAGVGWGGSYREEGEPRGRSGLGFTPGVAGCSPPVLT